MSRKQLIIIILIAFFIGAAGSIVLSRFFIPYVATVTGWQSLNKLTTSSPIIINRREEVHLNDGANLIDLIKQSGSFTVGIYGAKNNFLGNGIIVTSDGLILTANAIILKQPQPFIITNDGQKLDATVKLSDSKNNLALLSIPAGGLPAVQFDNAESLVAGQRLIYIGRSNTKFTHEARTGLVTSSIGNQLNTRQIMTDTDLNADYFGGPIVNLSGRVVGLVLNENENIIAENLENFINAYLAGVKEEQSNAQ